MSKLKKNLEYVKNEIYDIIKAIKDDETYEVILDFYEGYSKSMLDFIKTKNMQWFKSFFDMVEFDIGSGVTCEELKNEINGISRAKKQLTSYIIDIVFSEEEYKIKMDLNSKNNESEDNSDEDNEDNKSNDTYSDNDVPFVINSPSDFKNCCNLSKSIITSCKINKKMLIN
jgi:hypothetical protein